MSEATIRRRFQRKRQLRLLHLRAGYAHWGSCSAAARSVAAPLALERFASATPVATFEPAEVSAEFRGLEADVRPDFSLASLSGGDIAAATNGSAGTDLLAANTTLAPEQAPERSSPR